MRQTILSIALILLSILLSATILIQQRGSGLGSAFGGENAVYRTKRGLEKGLFYFTIALSCLFFATALLSVLVS